MNNGWIKLYRCLMDKPIWLNSTPEQKVVLATILMLANHEDKEWDWNGEKFSVKAGQFVTSLPKLAEKCGIGVSVQNVRTALKRFEKLGFLTDESTATGRLITVENWGIYQGDDSEANRPTNSHLTEGQQTPNRGLTANKNDKNVRMKEIYKVSNDTSLHSDEQRVVDAWNSLADDIGIKKIVKVNEGTNRKKMLSARIKQYGADEVIKAISNIRNSDFLQGSSRSGFVINFDWLLRPNNFPKVLEGNYDNKKSKVSVQPKKYDTENFGLKF